MWFTTWAGSPIGINKRDRREPLLSRRQFLGKAAVACGGAFAAGSWAYVFYSDQPVRIPHRELHPLKDYSPSFDRFAAPLSVVHGTNIPRMVEAALDPFGGIGAFVKPGDRVLIKPNVGWERQPEQAANTNPDVVGAVVRACRTAGASVVEVLDGSINDPYRCFARSGIERAVGDAGGEVLYPRQQDYLLTPFKGKLLKEWLVLKPFHKADKLINLPIVKHHSLSRCTLAMKNWYGLLGGQRNQLHQDIHGSIADLASTVRPTLTIMDATRVLKRNGPTGGSLSDVSIENTLIAGVDEVAIDSYSLRFLDLAVEDVPFIGIAEKRGLGLSDWKGRLVEDGV